MKNEEALLFIIKKFNDMINDNKFIEDKTRVKIVELVAEKIVLNPSQPIIDLKIKKTNEEYCKKELQWYLSQSLSIIGHVDDIMIWTQVCTKDDKKEVNSNYGWCVFNKDNYNQFDFVLKELIENKYSRRACMIYNRPSMTIDYYRDGMSDYMCTNYVQVLIRDNKLIYNIHQRSCDFIYGFFNDFYWHCYVYRELLGSLKKKYDNLNIGNLNYICDSLHVYERHFNLIQDIYKDFY